MARFRLTESAILAHRRKQKAARNDALQELLDSRPAQPSELLRLPKSERAKVFVTGSDIFDWVEDWHLVKSSLNAVTKKMIDPILVTTYKAWNTNGADKLALRWASWYYYDAGVISIKYDKKGRTSDEQFIEGVSKYIRKYDPDIVVLFRDQSFWHWKRIRQCCEENLVPCFVIKE